MHDRPQTTSFQRRNLPHWRVAGRPYFVTFRLKGSLPKEVSARLRKEYDEFLDSDPDEQALAEFQQQHVQKLEKILDGGQSGPLWLQRSEIAQLVMDGFDWLHNKRNWNIPAFVIMPNHCHCLMLAGGNTRESFETSLGIMKGFVGRQSNQKLGMTGKPFWTPENFDHWCRHPGKTEWVVEYIHENPVKAGLVKHWQDWPWLK